MNVIPLIIQNALLALLLVCGFGNAYAGPLFIDAEGPPPGFEQKNIDQHLKVSVELMSQHVGFYYVAISQGRLKFINPSLLMEQIHGLKDKQKISDLLHQGLALNIDCVKQEGLGQPAHCAKLVTQPIYAIYNPAKEGVYLYINKNYFEKPYTSQDLQFIPHSAVDWSYLNKLGVAGAVTRDQAFYTSIYPQAVNYYNAYSNNILAYQDYSLIVNLSQNNGLSEEQRFQVPNLYLQAINTDKIYTAGYINNVTSPFVQTQVIAGFGLSSTLATVKNTEAIATPLVLFIPQASQVSIFKNDQLIFSDYLTAGYQTINTSNFPDGGYELLIKIGSGPLTSRFFSKGSILPPSQAAQYYFTAGYLTNELLAQPNNYNYLPKVLDVPVMQAGLNKRIATNMAIFGDLLIDSHQGYLDLGSSLFYGNAFLKLAGLLTTKNNYGLYSMYNVQRNRLNFNMILTKLIYQKNRPHNFFLDNLLDNDSVSASYALSAKDFFGVQANYTRSIQQPLYYGAGGFYQRLLANYDGLGFYFNAAYNHAFTTGNYYSLSLIMQFSEGRLAGSEALLGQSQNGFSFNDPVARPLVVQGNTTYSKQNEEGKGYAVNETHTLSPTVSTLAGTYNYASSQAFISSYVNYNYAKGEHQTVGYGGSLETELAVNRVGVGMSGIERNHVAGILVRVDLSAAESDLKRARFALIDTNNRKMAVFGANETVFVAMPGFTDNNFTLINLSDVEYHIADSMRHITLYPGNVGHYLWHADKRIIVIGRILAAKHSPIGEAWIHFNNNGIYTDEEGYFQLELPQHARYLQVEDAGVCRVILPKFKIDKAYIYLGDVLCV